MTTQTITIDDFLRAREITRKDSQVYFRMCTLFSPAQIDRRGYATAEDTRVYDAIGALTDAVMHQKGFGKEEVANAWNTVSKFLCKGRSYGGSLPQRFVPESYSCPEYECSLPRTVPEISYY